MSQKKVIHPDFLPPPKRTLPTEGGKLGKTDFKPVSVLGQGSFGKVYKVLNNLTGKPYAIKVISKTQISNLKMIDQLRNEIAIMQVVEHKNIVRMSTYFEDESNIYLIMELGGPHLYSILKKKGKFSEKMAAKYIYDAASAVAYLHTLNPPIIHRDIKPENLLVCSGEVLKMADFGWSNIKDSNRQTYCGTPDYLAPEMINGSGHNEKLDVWSLGVLTYELLTGQAPFTPKNTKDRREKMLKLERNIMQGQFRIPSSVPPLAANLIKRILQKNPNHRPSASEIMKDEWFVKWGLAKSPPMLKRGVSSSNRTNISGNAYDDIHSSRRNMSASRRNHSPINVKIGQNTSYDKPKQLIPQQFSSGNVDDQGKFFTKKTVANKSNVKIHHSSKNITYTPTSPVVISTHQKTYGGIHHSGQKISSNNQNHLAYSSNPHIQSTGYVHTSTPRNASPALQLRSRSKSNNIKGSKEDREKTQLKNLKGPPLPYNVGSPGKSATIGKTYEEFQKKGYASGSGFKKVTNMFNTVDSFKTQGSKPGNLDEEILRMKQSGHQSINSFKGSQTMGNLSNHPYSDKQHLTKSLVEINSEGNQKSPAHPSKVSIERIAGRPAYSQGHRDTPIVRKANSFHQNQSQANNPLQANFQKQKDLKFHDSSIYSTQVGTVSKAEQTMLEDQNFSLKMELEKFKSLYNQEKSERETLEIQLNEYKNSRSQLENEVLNITENRNRIRDMGKDLEKANVLLKKEVDSMKSQNLDLHQQLNASKQREDTLKLDLQSSQMSQSKNSFSHEKEEKLMKAIGTVKFIRKESFEMAKKLKKMKPEWRPNTQNDKIFHKEVLNELWNRLEQLNAEKQRRDQESLMFMTNKKFLQDQISMSGNQPGSKEIIKQSLNNKKNFESAMHILDDIITNIEEANSNFDDSVIDTSEKRIDSNKVFDHLVHFFDKVEKIKDADSYKQLMDIYYS